MLFSEGAERISADHRIEEILLPVGPLAERHEQRDRAVRRDHALRELDEQSRLADTARRNNRNGLGKHDDPRDAIKRHFRFLASAEPERARDGSLWAAIGPSEGLNVSF